jgi:hypothetical protein
MIEYIPIQLVSSSIAASIRYKKGLNVIYKSNMQPGEVYFFRSATENIHKKGLVHGSFRISDVPSERRSIEIRCCIFKDIPTGAGSHFPISGGSKKKRNIKTYKTRRINNSHL